MNVAAEEQNVGLCAWPSSPKTEPHRLAMRRTVRRLELCLEGICFPPVQ